MIPPSYCGWPLYRLPVSLQYYDAAMNGPVQIQWFLVSCQVTNEWRAQICKTNAWQAQFITLVYAPIGACRSGALKHNDIALGAEWVVLFQVVQWLIIRAALPAKVCTPGLFCGRVTDHVQWHIPPRMLPHMSWSKPAGSSSKRAVGSGMG